MRVDRILRDKGGAVVTMGPRATLEEAARQLDRCRIGAVVVTDDAGGIVGILSERDIATAVARNGVDALTFPIDATMTRDVRTCGPDDTCEYLMQVMTHERVRHLPVLDGDRMIGIVSIGDVVKRRLDELQEENGALAEYLYTGR